VNSEDHGLVGRLDGGTVVSLTLDGSGWAYREVVSIKISF